jgi:hypothetical protein
MLPANIAGFLDQSFDFLRSGTSGDEEGIRHIHNDQVVYAKAGYQSAATGDNDTARNLFGEHYNGSDQ